MLRCGWRGAAWTVALAIAQCSGWAQTKAATVELKPYGVMTQPELDKMHPLDDPRPQYKGYVTSGPPGGIAWRGVGALAVDGGGWCMWDFRSGRPATRQRIRCVEQATSCACWW